MFEKEADWEIAAKLICDLLRGSGSLSVQYHSSAIEDGERQNHFSSWHYSQRQARKEAQDSEPRLFTLEQLGETLIKMSKADVAFSYETSGSEGFSENVKSVLSQFAAIKATSVQLAIGDVEMSWMLIGLSNPRDLILWKMQYHLRNTRL